MSKLTLVLFCASLAAARAGVLTRKGSERSNDVFTSFGEALPLDNAKAANSSLDVPPEKIIKVLNSTTSNATDLEGIDADRKNEKSRSHPKPDKVPKNTVLISETTGSINDSEVPPLNSTSLDSFPSLEPSNETQELNWPPKSISNETEGMNWPLNDFLNETDSQVLDSNEALHSRAAAVNGQTEPTNGEIAQILDENVSNDSASVEGYGIENNSTSIEELDGSLNETEFVRIDNFSLNITEGTKLSENLTDESETLFTDSNPAVESKNESVEMDPLTRANFSDNFSEKNSSSVVSQNKTEASINAPELNSSFELLTNATEGMDVSLVNKTDIKDTNMTSLNVFNTSEEINNEEFLNNTSDVEKSDSFIISETEVSSTNSSMEVNEESNSKLGIEDSFEKVPNQQTNGEGMFTNFGFDFLKNTQLAKNAVKAMEIFNLSDSITDHIIEENEFHSFLDTTPPPAEKQQNHPLGMNSSGISESVNETEKSANETEKSANETEKSVNETVKSVKESETSVKESETSVNNETSHLDIEGVTRLNDTVLSGNSTTNADDALKSPGNSSVVEAAGNPSVATCPPPGVCIFWFLAQDTCAVNSHCLGTRICCKIRCSKTCIEV